MSFSIWLSLVAVCCMGALSPGPSLAVILRVTLSGSPAHGVLAALTHGFGVGLWALVTMQGLAFVIEQYPRGFQWVSIAGGLYLAWLGVNALRHAGKGSAEKLEVAQYSYGAAARDGLMISLLNPKLALFFLALFSQFIASDMSVLLQFQLWATVVFIDSGWYILVALILAGGGVLTWLRKNIQWVDRGMGCVLILLGLKVVFG